MVRVFEVVLENGEKTGKKVYAVTGHTYVGTRGSIQMAKEEVARFKHEKVGTKYYACKMFIAPYKKGMDGLYLDDIGINAEPCVMVWK